MVTIPLYSFLFIYFAFLLFFSVFSLINFFHLVNTGTLTTASFAVTFFFLALTAIVLWATWYAVSGVYWQQTVVSWNFSGGNSLNLPFNGGL